MLSDTLKLCSLCTTATVKRQLLKLYIYGENLAPTIISAQLSQLLLCESVFKLITLSTDIYYTVMLKEVCGFVMKLAANFPNKIGTNHWNQKHLS